MVATECINTFVVRAGGSPINMTRDNVEASLASIGLILRHTSPVEIPPAKPGLRRQMPLLRCESPPPHPFGRVFRDPLPRKIHPPQRKLRFSIALLGYPVDS